MTLSWGVLRGTPQTPRPGVGSESRRAGSPLHSVHYSEGPLP